MRAAEAEILMSVVGSMLLHFFGPSLLQADHTDHHEVGFACEVLRNFWGSIESIEGSSSVSLPWECPTSADTWPCSLASLPSATLNLT